MTWYKVDSPYHVLSCENGPSTISGLDTKNWRKWTFLTCTVWDTQQILKELVLKARALKPSLGEPFWRFYLLCADIFQKTLTDLREPYHFRWSCRKLPSDSALHPDQLTSTPHITNNQRLKERTFEQMLGYSVFTSMCIDHVINLTHP